MDRLNIFVYIFLLLDLRERKGEGEEQKHHPVAPLICTLIGGFLYVP